MISVLLPVLFLVYDSLRSQVTLQAEVLTLRHQTSRPTTRQSETTRKAVVCRSPSLGVGLAALAGLEISAQDRKTRDRDCVASQRFSALLVLEKPTAPRSPASLLRVAGADSQNECR